MSETKTMSVSDLFADLTDVTIESVAIGDKVVKIASLSALDLIEWSEETKNAAGDVVKDAPKEVKRTAGARLVARCLIDDDGNRIGCDVNAHGQLMPKPAVIAGLRRKPNLGLLTSAAMRVNGLDDAPKNVSSEAVAVASPTV